MESVEMNVYWTVTGVIKSTSKVFTKFSLGVYDCQKAH